MMRDRSKSKIITRREALKTGSVVLIGAGAFGKITSMGSIRRNPRDIGSIGITPHGSSVIVEPGHCRIGKNLRQLPNPQRYLFLRHQSSVFQTTSKALRR